MTLVYYVDTRVSIPFFKKVEKFFEAQYLVKVTLATTISSKRIKIMTCVISSDAVIEEGAVCTNCVIMQGARIKVNAKVNNAIIAPFEVIESGQEINLNSDEIVLIANGGKK